jgi:hypothetical protein
MRVQRDQPEPLSFSHQQKDYVIVANSLAHDFLPDANLSKPAWREAARVPLVDTRNPSLPHPESATQASALWSRRHIYVAFWCHYSELNTYAGEDPQPERWELWKRDVAEVFINPLPGTLKRYWEFEVAPNNQWIDLQIDCCDGIVADAGWDSGFSHATRVDPQSRVWTCEMRIPSSPMGVKQIEQGMEWRINFYRCDGPGDDTERRFLAWSPTFQLNFHVAERFGWIRMGD